MIFCKITKMDNAKRLTGSPVWGGVPLSPQLLRSYGSLILMFGARVLHLLSLYSTNAPVRTGILPVGVWHWARSPATPSGPAGIWWMS